MSGVNAVEITDGDGARNALQRAGETAENVNGNMGRVGAWA